MSLCSAVLHERQSQDKWHLWGTQTEQRACRQVNIRLVALECGKNFIPTRLTLKSTESICDQIRPIGFSVADELNVNMHIGIL